MAETEAQAPDFKIDYNGQWYHDGAPIQRDALSKLFSDRALKIDAQGLYWLQTPYEKYPVAVEDVPYVVVDYDVSDQGDIDFVTNMEERIALGPDHVLAPRGHVPYIEVRDGLYARISRPVYYNLIEMYGEKIKSRGIEHIIGVMDE